MANKIQKIALTAVPALVFTKWEDFLKEMENRKGREISIVIGQYGNQRWLMFARNEPYEPLALDTAVALEVPCPPFCTEDEFYAVV